MMYALIRSLKNASSRSTSTSGTFSFFFFKNLPFKHFCLSSFFLIQRIYTAQQKFSMDFIFVLILVWIQNEFFEVINKCGDP